MNLLVSLSYLVALDDHRHFGRAALASHVTQPALSNAIRALEDHYGTAIVKRGRSFEGFTDEGARVLATARRILHEQELLQQQLKSSESAPAGALRIGAVPTAMPIAARFAARLQARHPAIVPTLRSMSSVELETGLDDLALDLAMGYAERTEPKTTPLVVITQYAERYFLLRRTQDAAADALGDAPDHGSLKIGRPIGWAQAAKAPLCLLSPEMHNRTIVDRAFAAVGARVVPVIETNSIQTLALSVIAGRVCSVMPGALVGTVQGHPGVEARPLNNPLVEVPIAFLLPDAPRRSRAMQAALAYANDPEWLAHAARHSGSLASRSPRG